MRHLVRYRTGLVPPPPDLSISFNKQLHDFQFRQVVTAVSFDMLGREPNHVSTQTKNFRHLHLQQVFNALFFGGKRYTSTFWSKKRKTEMV